MIMPAGPLRHLNFELFGRSLSARVLWLTVLIILVVEFAILLPSLGREREAWLVSHVTQAHLAAFSAMQSYDGTLDPDSMDRLLALSDAEMISLNLPGQQILLRRSQATPPVDAVVDLAHETLMDSTVRAVITLTGLGGQQLGIMVPSPLGPNAELNVQVNGGTLGADLRSYAAQIATFSIAVALVTGLLVFAALDRVLVRPMRILTASITGFRQDPEHAQQNDLAWLAQRHDNEIAVAARELNAMQDEMRAALWRNARLAAVGTAVAKISHDLRNILSSALLVADRLQESPDPVANRAARTLIPAVERAAQLVSRTVDFAREGPPPITRTAVALRELIEEAAQILRPDETGIRIDNQVPDSLVLPLDRDHIYRVLVNLMRNAAEAGADLLTLSVESKAGTTRMQVRDNGPGLPLRVQDNLFKPFTGSGRHGGTGLGLAIARDLIRAHGGDLVLAQTGPYGTVFMMELAVSDAAAPQDFGQPMGAWPALPEPAKEPPETAPKPRRGKEKPLLQIVQAALPELAAPAAATRSEVANPPRHSRKAN